MQITIELLNNFHGSGRSKTMKGMTTRDLTIEEGTAIYEFIEKVTKRLETKGREYWKKKDKEGTEQLFSLALNETAKESDNSLADEEWEGDWYVGD